MEELIKQITEAIRDYVVGSPQFATAIEKQIAEAFRVTDWAQLINDNVTWDSYDLRGVIAEVIEDRSNNFDQRVRDIVSDMRFTTEASRY